MLTLLNDSCLANKTHSPAQGSSSDLCILLQLPYNKSRMAGKYAVAMPLSVKEITPKTWEIKCSLLCWFIIWHNFVLEKLFYLLIFVNMWCTDFSFIFFYFLLKMDFMINRICLFWKIAKKNVSKSLVYFWKIYISILNVRSFIFASFSFIFTYSRIFF